MVLMFTKSRIALSMGGICCLALLAALLPAPALAETGFAPGKAAAAGQVSSKAGGKIGNLYQKERHCTKKDLGRLALTATI
jgi:hypothetical protein